MTKLFYNWPKIGNRLIWIEYSFVALAIMLPLLRPGYILTFDMVFTPKLRLPAEIDSGYLFSAALHYLNYLLPSQLIQKLLLFLILLLAGVGMHKLVKNIQAKEKQSGSWGAYFAGLFYMINPFTYERFMDGHYRLLLGYSLLPWFTMALWKWLQALTQPSPKQRPLLATIKLAAWIAGISVISLHLAGLILVLVLSVVLVWLWQNRRQRPNLLRLLKYGLLVVAMVAIASSYWLVPLLRGRTVSAQLIDSFDRRHFLSFRSVKDPLLGVAGNVAALYGYSGEREGRFTLAKEVAPWWLGMLGLIGILVIIGVVRGRRKYSLVVPSLVITAIVAWVLAIGIAAEPFANFNDWLIEYIPWWAGYREPQKFIGLIALGYAALGAIGIEQLLKLVKTGGLRQSITVGCLLLPLLYTPTMLWRFNNQLRPVDYPPDWYAFNNQLNDDNDEFRIWFLPWHQYLAFDFNQRIIANPAKQFFDKPIIQGDNAEIGLIERQTATPETLQIEEQVLKAATTIKDAGARLSSLGIKYVVLAKAADWQQYGWLDQQSDLDLVDETVNLKVYLNQVYSRQ